MATCKYGKLKHPVGRRRCKVRPKLGRGRQGPIQQFAGARRRRRRR